MRITMVGHSTVIMETAGFRVLTDPYFGAWGNLAYGRIRPPGMSREDLADVDLVLLSHNHWDHTDRRYFRRLEPKVPVLAPRRSAWVTKLKGAKRVVGARPWEGWSTDGANGFVQLSPWEGPAIEGGKVWAVPALHMATTVGFVIRAEGVTIYFAGDTYRRPFMTEIRRRFHPDVALMPVTTYRVPMTMGEKAAVKAAVDLDVSAVVPIHLGLQPRSPLLRTQQTPEGFARRLADARPAARVVILREGESWEVDAVPRGVAHGVDPSSVERT